MIPKNKGRHRHVTNTALIFSTLTLAFLLILSFLPLESSPSRRLSEVAKDTADIDYASYSCEDLYEYAWSEADQCKYARTCNDGEGVLAPIFFCSSHVNKALKIWLSPVLVLVMIVLFRMVSSTAEDFFSPTLEMYSYQLGLPPRFAGVTLLALGNGAPDVASIVNAMRDNHKTGYLLGLGELVGAGMFITTLVVGVLLVMANGVPCKGALIRDVAVYFITLIIVYWEFSSGFIDTKDVLLLFGVYITYVLVVLAADIYHRNVILPRSTASHQLKDQYEFAKEETHLLNKGHGSSNSLVLVNRLEHIIEGMSNYSNEDAETGSFSGRESSEDSSFNTDNDDDMSANDASCDHSLQISIAQLPDEKNSYIEYDSLWLTSKAECQKHCKAFFDDIYHNPESNIVDKFLLTLELPITLLRKITIPIPCKGYYCRTLVAVSLLLSPLWLRVYFQKEFDFDVFSLGFSTAIMLLPAVTGVLVLCFAPVGGGHMSTYVSAPLAFYGFCVAATWIDYIADFLVDFLSFMGVLYHIPGPIMGLTVLAFGNSVGDLSANVTVARKGLPNMAMTACFAGPVFNMLIGIGLGFSTIITSEKSVPVHLTQPLRVGLLFSMLNCILVVIFGVILYCGVIPKQYGYVALLLYGLYSIISILV